MNMYMHSQTGERKMKDKRFPILVDTAFFQAVKTMYAEPRKISVAEAFRAAMEDALTMAGLDWKQAVEKYHVGKADG
jgi:hypothetical protein